MEHDSQIIIAPDGTVLAATDSLPPGLVDARLEDRDGLWDGSPRGVASAITLTQEVAATGSMKLGMNGALTIATLNGANVEILDMSARRTSSSSWGIAAV